MGERYRRAATTATRVPLGVRGCVLRSAPSSSSGGSLKPRPAAAASRETANRSLAPLVLTAVAVGFGLVQALRLAWTSDDAYISFRYAENLVRGLGLVFNERERVEGYSNFLWTVWCALGLRLGFTAEAWANASSVSCYALTIAVLGGRTWSRRREHPGLAVPVAALLAAAHWDWAAYATSGLETSLVTLLAVLGFVLLNGSLTRGRLVGAGVVFSLAALTRPDGILFGVIGGLYVLWVAWPRFDAVLAYGIPLSLLVIPFAAWKLWYYGDVFPNTYYAKSAYLAWYNQGLHYLLLYLQKYWIVLAGPILAAVAWVVGRRRSTTPEHSSAAPDSWTRAALLAAAIAAVYTFYVVRVGGDFMFARLLIPVTPFCFLLIELGLERLLPGPDWARFAAAGALMAGMMLTPYPLQGKQWVRGITNEHAYYPTEERTRSRELGLTLRRCFEGMPMRVAFTGMQAILAYYSRVPVAIEANTGLTDSTIAHQPLAKRGRIGHEKMARIPYLIDRRKVHLFLTYTPALAETLSAYIPVGRMIFDSTTVTVMRWEPEIMHELQRRGAIVEDFEPALDDYIRHMDALPDSVVRQDYEKLRRFYFDAVRDSAREAAFARRLGSTSGAGNAGR